MALSVYIPQEQNDSRVAATSQTVTALVKEGLAVTVQSKAGEGSGISDTHYKEAGASIGDGLAKADVILAVNAPTEQQVKKLKKGSCWISHLIVADQKKVVAALQKQSVSCFSLNYLPRISRAQSMDSLSSQANLAGYKAVLVAAHTLPKTFPLQMTAAGTISPARVLVLGAGVAGLAAIATAKRLGAVVEASDIRAAAKEQVESLGASFVDVPVSSDNEDKGGYAKEASADFKKKQEQEIEKRLPETDIVITTALIPGRPAPKLLTDKMVGLLKPGSVVVDMAAAAGGNCSQSVVDKVVEKKGVTFIGHTNYPSMVAVHASQVYSKNVLTFFQGMIKDKELSIDFEDQIYQETVITHEGKIVQDRIKEMLT